MRLILRYVEGDGCTYSCTHTMPVEYESAEALLVEFMDAARAALLAGRSFVFLGQEFSADTFYEQVDEAYGGGQLAATYVARGVLRYLECPPDVLTVDEFFAGALRQG